MHQSGHPHHENLAGHTIMNDTYLPAGLPGPVPSTEGLSAEFWAATRQHRLVVQRCHDCRTWQWGPEIICRSCGSESLGYEAVSGKGIVYSWQRPHHPVHPNLKATVPYIVLLVELPDAGKVRMIGNLLGDPEQAVQIGMPVEAVFEDHAGETPFTLVQWKMAAG